MDEIELMALIAEGEGERLDLKRELSLDRARNKAEFVKDVISLANSAQGVGYYIVGVNNAKYGSPANCGNAGAMAEDLVRSAHLK